MFQQADSEFRSQMQHIAAIRHQAIVTVVREFPLNKRFPVVNAICACRSLHERFLLESLKPKFTSLVADFPTKSRSLASREKSGKTLGANPQGKRVYFYFDDVRVTEWAMTHKKQYSKHLFKVGDKGTRFHCKVLNITGNRQKGSCFKRQVSAGNISYLNYKP